MEDRMSSDAVTESGQPGSTESGDQGTQTNTEITADRSPEEYAKRLVEVSAENKKFRERTKQTQAEYEKTLRELQSLREEKAKEQGQWKSMYDELKSKYETESQSRQKERAAYAFKTVTSQFAAEAAKSGCARVDDLIKLASADGIISDLEVSEEDYSVTPESLKSALEKAQKAYPYLYARSTPTVRDGVPTNKPAPANKTDLSNMKVDDLVKLAKTLPN
jgi:membrane-associated HD superfamily phosphohydrolase